MADQTHLGSTLLLPSVLQRIGRLEIIARTVVEGYMTGRHRSPYKGPAIEFAQHREYVPGDDIRHLDWKVFAKRDRYTIKQFEVETNLTTMLIVDGSESMRTGEPSKYFTACAGAASIGWMLQRQQDAVGAAVFDSALREIVPPRAHQARFRELLAVLESAKPEKKTDMADVMKLAAERMPRKGMIIIFSDCFDSPEQLREGLNALRIRGHQVVLFHTLADEELTFPYNRMTRFVGLEDTGELLADPKALRKAYLDAINDFIVRTRRICVTAGVEYVRLSTADPLDGVIAAWRGALR